MTSSLAHLSCLSKLEHICIKGGSGSSAGDLVDAGLRQLTALRQLSSLDVSAAHLGKSALRYSGRFKLKVSPQGLKSYMMRNKVGIMCSVAETALVVQLVQWLCGWQQQVKVKFTVGRFAGKCAYRASGTTH